MPAIRPGSNKPAGIKVRKIRKRRAARGDVAGPPTPSSTTRPAPKSQPGPYTNTERRKVRKQKAKPSYNEAINVARKHGPATARGSVRLGEDKSDADRARAAGVSNEEIRSARKRVLRRTRPTGLNLVNHLADELIDGATIPSTGAGPNLGGRGNVPFTRVKAPRGAAAALAPKPVTLGEGRAASKVGAALAHDVLTFPAQAISSTYDVAAGAVEAAQGRPKRLKRIAKDFTQTDPIYNAAAAGVEKARGNDKAAASHLKKAQRAIEEHPGLAALEVYGVKGATGRTAGRVMRSGVAGEKVKAAGSTQRAPRVAPGTDIVERRVYSRDVLTKATQVAGEKLQRKRAAKLRRQAETATPDRALELRQKAARIDPDRLPEKEIKRRVDERVAVNEDIRRSHRSQITNEARQAVKGAGASKDVVSLVTQRITRATREDLAAYRDELAAQFDSLSPSLKRANKQLRAAIDATIDNPRADMAKLQEAANAYQQVVAPAEKILTDQGLLAGEQAARAKLIPYAVRNMGARHAGDHANAQRASARETLANVEARLDRLERQRQQKIGQHRSARAREGGEVAAYYVGEQRFTDHAAATTRAKETGQEVRRVALTRAEAERQGQIDRLDSAIANVKKERTTARKAVNDAKQLGAELLDSNGKPLSTDAILAHMENSGVEPPAFVTQAPNQRGAKNFNVRSERPVKASVGKRTGEATRKGTFDADPEALVEGAARSRGLADATQGFREIVKEFAHRGTGGKVKTYQTRNQAMRAAADAVHDANGDPIADAHELQPVRINPFGGTRKQLDDLLEHVDLLDHEQMTGLVEALRDAAHGKDGPGPWALIPRAAADRLVEHLNAQGGAGGIKTLQLANQAFRKTVLSTSTTWFAGNLIEGIGRMALAKAGPRSYLTGRKVLGRLEEISPTAAEEAIHRMVGGGHLSAAQRSHVRVGAQQFDGTALAPIANALGKFWRTPGPKQAAELWTAYTDFVFRSLNGRIESHIQTAMLGKELRKSDLMDGHTVKLGKAAIDEAARGLTKTENQVAFGRAVDRMYGKYSKFSPGQRKMISTYTPFAAWWMNSVYFVYRTLPRDHPVTTALIASAEQATEEWRKDHGLDLWLDKGGLPGFLQGTIPVKGGGHVNAARFTPFGAFGDPAGTAASQVNPLFSSVLAALEGKDWKGANLRKEGRDVNQLDRLVAAAHAFLTATVPGLSVAERVADKGPGTLNPVKTIKPAKPRIRKKKLKTYKAGRLSDGSSASRSSAPSNSGGFFNEGSRSSSGGPSGGGFFDGDRAASASSGRSGGFFNP